MEYVVVFTPKSMEYIEKQGITPDYIKDIDVPVDRRFLECGDDIATKKMAAEGVSTFDDLVKQFHDLVKQHTSENMMLVSGAEEDEKDIIAAAQGCAVEIVMADQFLKGPYHAWTLGY